MIKQIALGIRAKSTSIITAVAVAATVACPVFATGATDPSVATIEAALADAVITSDQLSPILQSVVSNWKVVLPFGIALMGLMLAPRIIKSLVKKFGGG